MNQFVVEKSDVLVISDDVSSDPTLDTQSKTTLVDLLTVDLCID